MKTLQSLLLLIFSASSLMAQINPDDMFISGYVTDANGLAQDSMQVCITVNQNITTFPLDTVCTFSNGNGWYFFDIPNGSVSGPNVPFYVFTLDPCNNTVLSETVNNQQGSVDTASVNFQVCANGGGCGGEIVVSVDSAQGAITTLFTAVGSGQPPFAYAWSNNATTQSISVTAPGVYCVVITDATGCSYTVCDTLGNNSGGCGVQISSSSDPSGSGSYTFVADPTGVPPFTYDWWVNGAQMSGQTVTYQFNGPGAYGACVTVTDATGCTSTDCDTIVIGNGGGCSVSITSVQDPNSMYIFTVTADPTGTPPFTYLWGNGSTTQTATYALNGTVLWDACVTVTDATGCVATACDSLVATDPNNGCQALFSWLPDNMLGSPLPAIQYTDLSQNAASWYWEFGDGTSSTVQNPIHAYSGNGWYVVCLTIVSADQTCQATYCDSVQVGNNNGGCNAAFSNSGPTPIGYTFSAYLQNTNYVYSWTVDGQSQQGGFDLYVPGFSNGVHTVCLTITDSSCTDSQCMTITVGGGNNCYGYISGQVNAGSPNYPLDEGVVYLIIFDPNTNQLTAIDTLVIDSTNHFLFGPLACGDYLIKAAATSGSAYYADHIPTYFGTSPFWALAETISIAQANVQITADINLIAANNPGGPGFIGGDVTQGANKTDPGDPLEGLEVMIFNMSGQAIAYEYTDANGSFGFNGLAYGTYQVYVEVVGIPTVPAIVTISPEQPSVGDVHIFATSSSISTGISEFDFEGAVSEVYPDPVQNHASIEFNLPVPMEVNISVLDLAGRMILGQQDRMPEGRNVFEIASEKLPAGYYLLQVQDSKGSFSLTRRFIRAD